VVNHFLKLVIRVPLSDLLGDSGEVLEFNQAISVSVKLVEKVKQSVFLFNVGREPEDLHKLFEVDLRILVGVKIVDEF